MELSRGAQRLLELLQSYARHSGRAFPFQSTLAEDMGVSQQMVRRNLLELKRAGLEVRKRQHSSAEYFGMEKLRSELRSELRSKAPYLIGSLSSFTGKPQTKKKPPQRDYQPWRDGLHLDLLREVGL